MEILDKECQIAGSQGKVKHLQKEISQRVKSFLNKSSRKISYSPVKHQGVQTDINQPFKQSLQSSLTFLSSEYSPSTKRRQSQDLDISHVSHRDILAFGGGQFPEDLNKTQLSDLLQKLIDQKRNQSEKKDILENDQILQETPQCSPQLWRMKRKMQKLKQKLKFESEMVTYAKEGLLLSEEENYRFRIQIKQIKSETQQKQSQLKLTSATFNIKRFPTQGVPIERQDIGQVNKLELQIKKLQEQIQSLKDLSFSMSNYLPISTTCEEQIFFRPESITQIKDLLKRVQDYCRDIEKEDHNRLNQMEQQKERFLTLLRKISQELEEDSRHSVWRFMKKNNQLAPYANIFTNGHPKIGRALFHSSSQPFLIK